MRLNKGFRLFNFLQSASWIWKTKSDFLLSANVMVSCNVLTRWAHNLEWQMNLMGFVCVHCNWRNKFQLQCSERRVFLRLAFNFRLVSKFFMTYWYEVLTPGRSLLSSRTSAAFLFWLSAVICLHFSVLVRIVRRRRFTGIDVWLLWSFCAPIILTPLFAFSCCLFLPAEVPVPKLKFHD